MKMALRVTAVVAAATLVAWADTPIDKVLPVGAKDRVEIYNVKGWIEVRGWDRNEVHVSGTLGKNVERLDFDHSGDKTEIRVVIPKMNWRVGDSNLTVEVPAGNQVRVECVSGSVDVQNIQADLELRSVSGSVRATDCAGDVDAKSISGSVRILNGAGNVRAESVSGSVEVGGDFGEVEVQSVSGSVRVKMVRDEVRATSVSGSVGVEGTAPREVECTSTSGSVSYSGGLAPGAKVNVTTHSGSVKLRLPSDVSARINAESFSGTISNTLSDAQPVRRKDGPGTTLDAKLGDGSAHIRASAFSGSVTIGTE